MLRSKNRLIHKIVLCIDAAVVAASFLIAFMLRDYLDHHFLIELPPPSEYLPLLVVVVPLWNLMLKAFGVYDSMRKTNFSRLCWGVFEASLVATLIFSTGAFLLQLEILSRTFVMTFFAVTTSLLMIEKSLALLYLRKIRKQGFNFRAMLIVGSGPRSRGFAETIESHPEWGMKILGFIDEEEMLGRTVGSSGVIGVFDDLARILDENVVDEVIFIMPRNWLDRLEKYVRICEKVGVKATISIDFFDTAIAKPVLKELDGWPLLTFDSTPNDFFYLSLKRILDLIGSGLGLIFLSPLFLAIALTMKLTSRGPVFFRQIRCGVNGRTFQILKFRTMIVDAEKKLAGLQQQNELKGPAFKIRNDPRITAIGRFLRKTSLDELPQLINVLRGDMSLVGPRPPLPSEVERYERWQRRRLSMRPGITCIHEVVARNDKDFNNWMKMDLEYIDNWCFGLDLRILARTVLAVARGTGC